MCSYRFYIGFILPFLGVILLNWYVDPARIFYFDNSSARSFNNRERASLVFAVKREKPKAIMIGSSRTRALDPKHPGWSDPPLNMGFHLASMYEIEQYFVFTQDIQPLHTAVVELSFDFYNTNRTADFASDRLLLSGQSYLAFLHSIYRSAQDLYYGLFSKQSTAESIGILLKQYSLSMPEILLQKKVSKDVVVDEVIRDKGDPSLSLRRIIRSAAQNKTKLYFYIPPNHAPFSERIFGAKWDRYEQWKRHLVKMIDETANDQEIELWDFSAYVPPIVTEPLSPKRNYMNLIWFKDRAHFTAQVGTYILNRVFHECANDCPEFLSDFGVLLTKDTVERELTSMRSLREAYLATKPIMLPN